MRSSSRHALKLGLLAFAFFFYANVVSAIVTSGLNEGLEQYQQGNYQAAIDSWRPLAELGDSAAQFNIALAFEKLGDSKENRATALTWLQQASDNGYAPAQGFLGIGLVRGAYGEPNPGEGVKLLKRAAESSNLTAAMNLGVCFQQGIGVEKNFDEARRWFELAGRGGDANGWYALGRLLQDERQSYGEAANAYAAAVELGDQRALVQLGWLHANGKIPDAKPELGYEFYKRAVDAGVPNSALSAAFAARQIGRMDLAFPLLGQAAESGDPIAQFELGHLAEKGVGRDKNVGEAIYWYERSANSGLAKSSAALARLFANGADGVAINTAAAVYWSQRAGQQRNADPRIRLAINLLSSPDPQHGRNAGIELLDSLTAEGDSIAATLLGIALLPGNSGHVDGEKARALLRSASEAGVILAQFHLGTHLVEHAGEGAYDEGVSWLVKAERTGLASASMNLSIAQLRRGQATAAIDSARRALQAGVAGARYVLAVALLEAGGGPTGQWGPEAMSLLREAANNRYDSAMLVLADVLAGSEDRAALDEAMFWYGQLADRGMAVAQFNLALIMERLKIQSHGKWTVYSLFTNAAQQGFMSAYYDKGRLELNTDSAAARRSFQVAAENGHVRAAYNLATMQMRGMGGEVSLSDAAHYYRLAERSGHIESAAALALMTERGLGGVERNLTGAKSLYKKSSTPWSVGLLGRLDQKLKCERRAKTQLFGVKLACAQRYEFEQVANQLGLPFEASVDGLSFDTIEVGNVFEGASELFLAYQNDHLVEAEIRFPPPSTGDHFPRLRDTLVIQFGQPDSSIGLVKRGRLRYIWHRSDGVDVELRRGWPSREAFLVYVVRS